MDGEWWWYGTLDEKRKDLMGKQGEKKSVMGS